MFPAVAELVCGVLLISGGINRYFSYQHNKSMFASIQHGKAEAVAADIEFRMRRAGPGQGGTRRAFSPRKNRRSLVTFVVQLLFQG